MASGIKRANRAGRGLINVPDIVEVIDPETGHMVVTVRIPITTANTFPDKPWNTPISELNIAARDIEKYQGYVLVDMDGVPGGEDLIWIFQKLEGPDWTTITKSRENLTPQKFRKFLTQTKVKTEVVPETPPDALEGDLVVSVVERQDGTGKATRMNISESIDENLEPLTGSRAYMERELAFTEETLIVDDQSASAEELADTGLMVISSQISPNGDGKSVKETVTATQWSLLTASKWDDDINAQVTRTEQFVEPPSGPDLSEANTSFEIVNKDRSMKIVEVVPTSDLDSFLESYPIQIDLTLPDELISASISFEKTSDEGSFESEWGGIATGIRWSLSGSESGQAHSSASVMPSVAMDIRQVWGRDLSATAHFFFLPRPVTEAAILAKVGAARWPVFKPVGHVITAIGEKAGVQVNATAAASKSIGDGGTMVEMTKGKGSAFDHSQSISTIRIPPTLHDEIDLGAISDFSEVNATADIGWAGYNFPTVDVNITETARATGSISVTILPATSPTQIPRTGIFLVRSKVELYKWGYAKVYAETFDASQLA